MGDKFWYVIHTYTGYEEKVADAIHKAAKKKDLEGFFGTILVPTEEVTTHRRGKKVRQKKVIYPGYVLIEMEINRDTWALVRRTTGVTGFVGQQTRRNEFPPPLSADEVHRLLTQVEEERPRKVEHIPFSRGDAVTVTRGPFGGFNGVVEEVYPERGKVKVMVTIFERATPVEIDIPLVEKV